MYRAWRWLVSVFCHLARGHRWRRIEGWDFEARQGILKQTPFSVYVCQRCGIRRDGMGWED